MRPPSCLVAGSEPPARDSGKSRKLPERKRRACLNGSSSTKRRRERHANAPRRRWALLTCWSAAEARWASSGFSPRSRESARWPAKVPLLETLAGTDRRWHWSGPSWPNMARAEPRADRNGTARQLAAQGAVSHDLRTPLAAIAGAQQHAGRAARRFLNPRAPGTGRIDLRRNRTARTAWWPTCST